MSETPLKSTLYTKIENSREELGPLVVLDVFSGIGSGIVVLKKLGIAIKTVISVEDDPLAAHVAKYNHDSNYNGNISPDNIQYVENYTTFEDLVENLDKILRLYGPIDLLMGRPPSVGSGKYIIGLGNLMTTIKNHASQ
eukprot:150313_1